MPREQFEFPFTELPRLSHFGFSDQVAAYEFGPHYHYGYEIIFVTKGEAKVELFKNRSPVYLKADDLCIISPKIIHEFIYEKQSISFYWMGFQTGSQVALAKGHMQPPPMLIQKKKEYRVKYFTLINQEIDKITEKVSIDDYFIIEKVPFFYPIFSEINDELHNQDQYSSKIVYQKILEIFMRIARQFSEEKRTSNPALHYVKNYLDSHCLEKIDLYALSEKAGYTQEHLSRLFKSSYGRSPKKYHNEKRLTRACQQLSGGASVEDTAKFCGFDSVSYFSTWFKRRTGFPPQKY